MPRDTLRHTLDELHAELEAAGTLDPEARAMLRSAAREIQHALEAGAPAPAGEASLGDRLEESTRHFEATHPKVAEAVRRVIDALAALGI
jgi:hypothetical protein